MDALDEPVNKPPHPCEDEEEAKPAERTYNALLPLRPTSVAQTMYAYGRWQRCARQSRLFACLSSGSRRSLYKNCCRDFDACVRDGPDVCRLMHKRGRGRRDGGFNSRSPCGDIGCLENIHSLGRIAW